ncbi:Ubiquinone biosynthesis protein coq9, mitochondrial [Coemansia sp. Benny D115]|nr:Ubiquinone biosynthesis protein coq9, mitochondrial [Coemansia sp. Benny D115]
MFVGIKALRPAATLLFRQQAAASAVARDNNCRGYTTGAPPAPQQQLQILDQALTHVNELGWGRQALIQACQDLGYSPQAHTLGSGSSGLIEHFLKRAQDDTLIEVDDQLHELDTVADRLRLICRVRLRQTRPLRRRWPEAAAVLAQPANVAMALERLSDMSSQFWYAAGDDAQRVDWYLKRSGLAAAYVATELYMCEDGSPDLAATWEFLDRRLEALHEGGNAGVRVAEFANQTARNFYGILASTGFLPPRNDK